MKAYLSYLAMGSFVFTTITANAATAPIYDTLRKIDVAIGAMVSSEGSAPFNMDLNSATVHKVVLNSAETLAEVTINNTSCTVTISKIARPSGLAGAQQYMGSVVGGSCGVIREDLKTMAYSKVKNTLLKSAEKYPKLGLNFEVTKKGTLKIGNISANDPARLK